MVGEGGVVAAAVVRVEDQGHVQGPGLQIGVAAVLPQHPQEVL
ncbi:Lipoprotein, partial [Dysosmobacter welbionis]